MGILLQKVAKGTKHGETAEGAADHAEWEFYIRSRNEEPKRQRRLRGNFLPPAGLGRQKNGGREINAEAQASFFWGSADLVEWPANTFTFNYRYLPIDTVRYRLERSQWVQKLDTPARLGGGGGVFGGLEPLHRYNLHFTEGF